MSLTDQQIQELEHKANEIRKDLMVEVAVAGSGHSGGPLGMADIFTAFYFHVLKHDAKRPDWLERDRLILSNGHIVPVRYAAMAHAGYFPREELLTLRKINSRLEGHPAVHRLPAVETSSGPLGEGLSLSCGMALAARMDKMNEKYHIWCLMSDGEHQEGMTWEAAMLAGKYKLDNLTAIVDRNNIQIDGRTEDIMPLEPLRDKYEAFGWHVMEMNAHDFAEIVETLQEAKAIHEKPTFIIAHTTPGKGVSFMENRYEWHGVPPGSGPEDIVPKDKQLETALRELGATEEEIQEAFKRVEMQK